MYMAIAQKAPGEVRAVCVDRESIPVETGVGGSGGVVKQKKEQHENNRKQKKTNMSSQLYF